VCSSEWLKKQVCKWAGAFWKPNSCHIAENTRNVVPGAFYDIIQG
jgi:hypothetical protein